MDRDSEKSFQDKLIEFGKKNLLILGLFSVGLILIGIGLASLQIIPASELLANSQRALEPHPYEWAFLPWQKIVTFLVPYEKVIVYYGKFESIITQTPISTDLTGNTIGETKNPVKVTYLVEPTLEETLTFFASEIFSSVFVQSIHESQLAKFASRMFYMDKANQKIKERIKQTVLEKQRLKHQVSNRKQLQTLSALTQWKP